MSADKYSALQWERYAISSQILPLERVLAIREYDIYMDQRRAIIAITQKDDLEFVEEIRVESEAAVIRVKEIKDEPKRLSEEKAAIEEKIKVMEAAAREYLIKGWPSGQSGRDSVMKG